MLKQNQLFVNEVKHYFDNADYHKAEEILKKIAEIEHDSHAAQYNLGLVLKKTGKLDRALDVFTKIIDKQMSDCDVYYQLGILRYMSQEYDKAEDLFSNAIKAREEPHFYFNRGIVHHRTGNFDRAKKDYSKAISLGGQKNPLYLFNIGLVTYASAINFEYNSTGETKKLLNDAENFFDNAIKYSKDNKQRADAHYQKGASLRAQADLPEDTGVNLHQKNELYNKALQEYQTAVELTCNNPDKDYYAAIGKVLCILISSTSEVKDYNRYLEFLKRYESDSSKVDGGSANYNFANALCVIANRTTDPDDAARYYKQAIDNCNKAIASKSQDVGQAYIVLGNIYYDLHNSSIQEHSLLKSIKKQALERGNKNALGGFLGAAFECYNNTKGSSVAFIGKGNIYYVLGKYFEAEKSYQDAIDLAAEQGAESALYYCNLGKALYKQHGAKCEKAADSFKKANELSQAGKIGFVFNTKSVDYINDVLTKDYQKLVGNLVDIQKVSMKLNDDHPQKKAIEIMIEKPIEIMNAKTNSVQWTIEESNILQKSDVVEIQRGNSHSNGRITMSIHDLNAMMESMVQEKFAVLVQEVKDLHHQHTLYDASLKILKNKVNIKAIYGIEYDNELLNHQDLINFCLNKITFTKILDLGSQLNSDLITEALNTDNYNMVLAGLMSLDDNLIPY